LTGAAVLAFILFHLAHYTFAWVTKVEAINKATSQRQVVSYLDLVDAHGRRDVYTMVVAGFSNPVVSTLYIVAMLILFIHLKHGIGSVFQSLGLNAPRIQPAVRWFSLGLAAALCFGNIALVVLVWAGFVPVETPPIVRGF
jgi:succinate dehydrogenase / fumarate reductase cytochrome b subunit